MQHDSRRIAVLGAQGQVGRALVSKLVDECIAVDRAGADLAHPGLLPSILDRLNPSAVINAAAYTAVDRAEIERELAMTVNGESPGVIANWCAQRGIPMVHFSTDYVFPGTGSVPWREDDPVAPLNHYGATKLAGEIAIAEAGAKSLVLRTSWVYDSRGRNFVTTMLRLARERESLSIVADQHGAPTYAPHLTRAAIEALRNSAQLATFPTGIYHVCNSGETTWYEFALEIFAAARDRDIDLLVKDVAPIATADYKTPAPRPLNSRLDTQKASAVLGISLPHWRDGLFECMDDYEGL